MKKRYFSKSFKSLDAFAGYLDAAEVQPLFSRKDDRSSEEESSSRSRWTTTKSLAESADLLKFGDRANARRLVGGVSVPGAVAESIRARRVRCVAGSSVNVAAALAGRPKSMYKIVRKNVPAKVLNIAYNENMPSGVDASEAVRVSCMVANTIISLEKSGYQVNLYSAVCLHDSGEVVGCFVRVKSAGQYIDVSRLAYCLVNPSFLRRSVFRFVETLPGLESDGWRRHYGRCDVEPEDVSGLARAAGLDGPRVLSFLDICKWDEARIAAAILGA